MRLLLDPSGGVASEFAPLPEAPLRPLRVGLAAGAVDSASVWLYHKTTRREPYLEAQRSRSDCDEVLLRNERGELTESPIANAVFEVAGERVTPPVSCGLLPGIERARLVSAGAVRERVVRASELRIGARFWLVSAVRGTREAVFVG